MLDDNKGWGSRKVKSLKNEVLAVRYLFAGFKYSIVSLELGTQPNFVKGLWITLRPPELIKQSYKLQSPRLLVDTYSQLMAASEFIVYYMRVGKGRVHKTVDIEAVIRAYRMYCETHDTIHGGRGAAQQTLSINIAWLFARDLRSGEIEVKTCEKCSVHYIEITGQKIECTCPYCALNPLNEKDAKGDG